MADEKGKEEAVEVAVLSRDEYVTLAVNNKMEAANFAKEKDGNPPQLMEAANAYYQALENARKAFGDTGKEAAEYYHLYGSALMRHANAQMEEQFKSMMLQTMAAQEEGSDAKLTKQELEEEAETFEDDYEDAWESLEVARTIYEAANDQLGVAGVRMSLGDACADVEQWEDAIPEYGDAARIFADLMPDSRRLVEALFLKGLAHQMIAEKDSCREAFGQARDTMKRFIASLAADATERDDAEKILVDLEEKVAQVTGEEFWIEQTRVAGNVDAIAQEGEQEPDDDEDDDEEGDDADELRKRLIDDSEIPASDAAAAVATAEAPPAKKAKAEGME